jgi:Positive regulator of sigma E activity
MASGVIKHRGKIVSISGNSASVEIVSRSACASCHAAGLCGASESKIKLVQAKMCSWESFRVGQEVEVCFSRNMGLKAVLLSYVLPLMILMLLILLLSNVFNSELVSGLVGLAGVGTYYFVLYLFRNSLKGDYEFTVRALTE